MARTPRLEDQVDLALVVKAKITLRRYMLKPVETIDLDVVTNESFDLLNLPTAVSDGLPLLLHINANLQNGILLCQLLLFLNLSSILLKLIILVDVLVVLG